MTPFTPLRRRDGYLPIEDHGLIGDGTTTALVARDGAVTWLCVPRFDSPPLFCSILDAKAGGEFRVAPVNVVESRQYYEEDTAVLVTELRSAEGLVRVTDALTFRSGADLFEDVPSDRGELVRLVEVLAGPIDLEVTFAPRGGATLERAGDAFRVSCPVQPDLRLSFAVTPPIDVTPTRLRMDAGDRMTLALRWSGWNARRPHVSAEQLLGQTADAWRRWASSVAYEGPRRSLIRRSAITLKMLDHFGSGAIVAAPTSSLPEAIGGERNWDYRYAWIRDAAFSVYAFHRIGMWQEGQRFLSWVLDTVERHGRPRVLYTLDGDTPPDERIDETLEGYRRSLPVRWGNGAKDQMQHDVYGEILDCAYQWAHYHGSVDESLWARLLPLVESARREWRTPDQGIWEVRTAGRPFTYSAAMCQVALDRGARLAERYGLPGDIAGWRSEADRIVEGILGEAVDPRTGAITEHLGGGFLDASILALPLRRVIPADHPAMVATVRAVRERLGAGNGLVYRYLPDDSPDGLAGHEGAFVLCSFWLIDNLAYQGRFDEAIAHYESLCDRVNPLGLLPEQIDPGSGEFLGNYPQAFSHVGLITSGMNLSRLTAATRPQTPPERAARPAHLPKPYELTPRAGS